MRNTIKSKVVSGLIWRFAERIFAQGISLVVSIILARILEPSDYGAISLIMIFITIANVFVDSGFSNALVQKEDADSLDFSTVFYFNIVFSFVLYGVIFLCSPFIAEFYGMPVLNPALRVLAIQVIIAAVKSTQVAYVQRNMLFKRFFWSTLGGTVFSGIVGVVMAYMGFGIWAIVVQYLSNSFVDTTVLCFTVKWRPTFQFSMERWKKLFSFGWKIFICSIMNTIYEELRSFIIGKKYSKADLAYYTKGKQWPYLIINNVNTSISSVLFPALSQYQNDKIKLKEMTRKAISVSSYILDPLLMGLGALATPIISLLLTDKWLPVVPYMIICCFYLMFMPLQTANLEAIKAIGRSDVLLKLDIIKKTIQISILLIAMNFGVMAIAVSAIFTTLMACVINAWPNRKLLNYGFKEQLFDLLPNLVLSSVMFIIVFAFSQLMQGVIPQIVILLCGFLIGVCVYILLSIITRSKDYFYIINNVKSKLKNKG